MAPWHLGSELFSEPDDLVDYWSKLFQDTVEQPNYELKVRTRDKEWMTREIQLMIKKRNRLYERFKRTRDQNHCEVFRNQCREVNSIINKTKEEYFGKLIHTDRECNSKSYYKIIKRFYTTSLRVLSHPF